VFDPLLDAGVSNLTSHSNRHTSSHHLSVSCAVVKSDKVEDNELICNEQGLEGCLALDFSTVQFLLSGCEPYFRARPTNTLG
jgi:hypothetical protein